MSISDGTIFEQTEARKIYQTIPSGYVVYVDGSNYKANPTTAGGTPYSSANAQTTIDNAMTALGGKGHIHIKSGNYGGATVTLQQYISAYIDPGVSNLTIAYHASWYGMLVNSATRSLVLGSNGEIYRFKSWGAGESIHLRSEVADTQTMMKLVPNGSPSPFTTLLQCFNTDIEADWDNYECLEMAWESNVAFLNSFQGGTGTLRDFQLMVDAKPMVWLVPTLGSDSGLLFHCNYKNGDPNTTDLPDGWCGVFRNTTTGTVKLWANNSDTLYSVELTAV
jgi:hypothetical protein